MRTLVYPPAKDSVLRERAAVSVWRLMSVIPSVNRALKSILSYSPISIRRTLTLVNSRFFKTRRLYGAE